MAKLKTPGAVAAATGGSGDVQADGQNEFQNKDTLLTIQVSHLRRRLALTEARARLIAALAFAEVPR